MLAPYTCMINRQHVVYPYFLFCFICVAVVDYHIFTVQKEDRFFEGHHVRRCPFFFSKASEAKKKGHHVRKPLFALKLSKVFRGRMI